jgi:hypothetical protein
MLSSSFIVSFVLLLLIMVVSQDKIIIIAAAACEGDDDDNSDTTTTTTNNNNDEGTCISRRAPPQILTNGSFKTLDSSYFEEITSIKYDELLDGTAKKDDDESLLSLRKKPSVANIPGGESISLRYVKDLIAPEIASKLIESCDKRSGWTSSPQSVAGSATVKATRTSRSCPLIWPQLYLPLLDDPSKSSKLASVKDEIDLTWHLTQRIASFLNVGEEYIEPFQLVRYQPGEFYKEHHDHGSYYGVSTEQRPLTLLIFLSDLPSSSEVDNGGYTKFRALGGDGDDGLGIAVVPRQGDGVLWKNEDENGTLLMDAVHEAIPPKDGGDVIKYAMNVWIAGKKIKENLDVSSYRTS